MTPKRKRFWMLLGSLARDPQIGGEDGLVAPSLFC